MCFHSAFAANDTAFAVRAVQDIYVRFLLRSNIRAIRKDDKEIHWEGIESLDDDELRSACEMRGIRTMTSVPPAPFTAFP